MFRRIIVAYDGSPHADDALALAQRLRDPAGTLILACAVTSRPWHRHAPAAEAMPDEVAAVLEEARARVPAGVHVALRAPAAASPARALTELTEAEDADLVVIGSSRRASGVISLERTAGRLLQGAPCAVAVAPAGLGDVEPFRHVGVAYDGSAEAEVALGAAYAIAAASGAAVTLMYALPEAAPADVAYEDAARRARLHAQEALDAAAEAAPAGVNPRTVLLYGLAGRVIADAGDGVVDLLVIGSRGYGPVQRALLGSVSEVLMDGARHPVLVLPRAARAKAAAEQLSTRAHAS
jgi:nucleotide-binding universal stress UspA family protein